MDVCLVMSQWHITKLGTFIFGLVVLFMFAGMGPPLKFARRPNVFQCVVVSLVQTNT